MNQKLFEQYNQCSSAYLPLEFCLDYSWHYSAALFGHDCQSKFDIPDKACGTRSEVRRKKMQKLGNSTSRISGQAKTYLSIEMKLSLSS